jgi:hypothetical protein
MNKRYVAEIRTVHGNLFARLSFDTRDAAERQIQVWKDVFETQGFNFSSCDFFVWTDEPHTVLGPENE